MTDEQIIKVLEAAWHRAPNTRPADAWLLTSDVARSLQISMSTALKHLKRLRGNKVRGIQKGRTWLWVWAEGWSNVSDIGAKHAQA